MTAEELVARAREWVGVPFRHQGRSKEFGVDCAGLLEVLLNTAGILPEDYSAPRTYGRRPNGELRTIVERYCRRASRPIAGAVVLVSWPHDIEPGHVALCTGPNIIHAYARVGRVVENGYRGPWIRNTHSLWLVPGIAYE